MAPLTMSIIGRTGRGTDKVAFALQLKADRDASFMTATESHVQNNTTNNTMLKGWLIEAQVVAQRKPSPVLIL